MAEIDDPSDIEPDDEEGEDVDLPPVGAMALDEIEEDLDYLFRSQIGSTVVLTWFVAGFATMGVLRASKASTWAALIALAAWFVTLVATYLIVHGLADRFASSGPDSRFRHQYVWLFSLVFNGPRGIVLVKMPHERIQEMFERRYDLLRGQHHEGYSPVNPTADRKWQALGRLLFEMAPSGLARAIQGWYFLLLVMLAVIGVIGLVQLALSMYREFLIR